MASFCKLIYGMTFVVYHHIAL